MALQKSRICAPSSAVLDVPPGRLLLWLRHLHLKHLGMIAASCLLNAAGPMGSANGEMLHATCGVAFLGLRKPRQVHLDWLGICLGWCAFGLGQLPLIRNRVTPRIGRCGTHLLSQTHWTQLVRWISPVLHLKLLTLKK